MKCEELLAMLNDYVDGGVNPGVCDQFAQHLAGCNPCQVVVDNIRQTITLYKEGSNYQLDGPSFCPPRATDPDTICEDITAVIPGPGRGPVLVEDAHHGVRRTEHGAGERRQPLERVVQIQSIRRRSPQRFRTFRSHLFSLQREPRNIG